MLTKVTLEDREIMILQMNNEKLGPLWRQTQGPDRKRSSQLMMPIPRGEARVEGGLAVAGVANQREGKEFAKDDIVVGRIQEDSAWVAEGTVEEVCRGNR